MNWRGSPFPHYLKGERFCFENKTTVKPEHLYLFFFPVRCKMKLLILFFLTKYFLLPCKGELKKAKAWANWNLQVSNSHFSFSTWAFALLGFLQSGCSFSWHLRSFLFLEQKSSGDAQPCIRWVLISSEMGEGPVWAAFGGKGKITNSKIFLEYHFFQHIPIF